MAFDKEPISYEEFIERIKEYNPHANVKLIKKAYDFAKKAHKGKLRQSGEEYFTHPVEVARILTGLKADTATICAALLHDTVEDTSTKIETIVDLFGEEIANLVEGVTHVLGEKFATKEEYKAENLRKMLLASTNDLRVLIMKLADRLHNMRTLSTFREEKRKRIAQETLDIYAPIAHKLGMWRMKGELEDLSLRYLDFETYSKLKEHIAEKRTARERVAAKIVNDIIKKLKDVNIQAHVTGRAKYFYSIFKKMRKKGKEFDQIYDLIAIRIITNTVEECYKALEIVHTSYSPKLDHFKDYIAHPKANGYQSIHTTVLHDKRMLEVQIKTEEMHHIAEEGVAAHWKYKGTEKDRAFDRRIIWTKQILDWKRKSKNATEFVESLKIDLFENEVIVFTPKGDPISLPEGATPLDFAYSVHSNIGNKCSKVMVNNKLEPLDYQLNSGDVVEIITNKNAEPSRNWMKFAKTPKARSKIRVALGIEGDHKPKDDRTKASEQPKESIAEITTMIDTKGKKGSLKFSKCCLPSKGDDLVGFYTKDNKITVHKTDCINVHTLDESKKVELGWLETEDQRIIKLKAHVTERPGVLADILNKLIEEKVDVESVNTRTRKRKILLTFKMTMKEQKEQDRIENIIKSLPDVSDVHWDYATA